MCSQSISGARTRKHGDHPHICVLRWLRVPRVFLSAPLSSDAVAFYLSRGAQHLRDGKLATSYYEDGSFFCLAAPEGMPSPTFPGFLDCILFYGQKDLFVKEHTSMSIYQIFQMLQ